MPTEITAEIPIGIPTLLTIAGSDNSGGAGVQADIKTCIALNIYPVTVLTAVTAQNASGVKDSHYVGNISLQSQLSATFDCIKPSVIKIGLLNDNQAFEIISEFLQKYRDIPVVTDPVLSATAGGRFGDLEEIIKAYKKYILPFSTYITPNIKELKLLCKGGQAIKDIDENAKSLIESYGTQNVVVTGGDENDEECTDRFYNASLQTPLIFKSAKIQSPHTHGTGCTFSTSLACYLAKGMSGPDAVKAAKQFTENAIKRGLKYPVIETYGPVHQNDF